MLISSLSFIISFPVSAAGNTKMGCIISEGDVTVGDTFNVTVWLNASETVDSWWVGQLSFNNADANSVSIDPYWWGFCDNGTIDNNNGRITGIQAEGATSSTIAFKSGGVGGTVVATFKFGDEGIDFYVPGSGILFDDGVYLDLTATPGVTITFT